MTRQSSHRLAARGPLRFNAANTKPSRGDGLPKSLSLLGLGPWRVALKMPAEDKAAGPLVAELDPKTLRWRTRRGAPIDVTSKVLRDQLSTTLTRAQDAIQEALDVSSRILDVAADFAPVYPKSRRITFAAEPASGQRRSWRRRQDLWLRDKALPALAVYEEGQSAVDEKPIDHCFAHLTELPLPAAAAVRRKTPPPGFISEIEIELTAAYCHIPLSVRRSGSQLTVASGPYGSAETHRLVIARSLVIAVALAEQLYLKDRKKRLLVTAFAAPDRSRGSPKPLCWLEVRPGGWGLGLDEAFARFRSDLAPLDLPNVSLLDL